MFLRRIRVILAATAVVASAPVVQAGPLIDPAAPEHAGTSVGASARSSSESLPLGVNPESSAEQAGDAQFEGVASVGLGRTLSALAGVTGLAVLCALAYRWAAQKRGGLMAALGPAGRAPSGILEVLARYPVARTHKLVLLRVGRRVLLVCQSRSGRGSGAMTTLAEFDQAEEVAALLRAVRQADHTSSEAAFREALDQAERLIPKPPVRPACRYSSPSGDTVELSDPRIRIPDRAEPSDAPIDPAIGRLRSRLAAMRMREGSA